MSLEAELVMRDGEVVGTKMPTGDSLLVDCRFELPFGKLWHAFKKKFCRINPVRAFPLKANGCLITSDSGYIVVA